jgi:hypothetical protein
MLVPDRECRGDGGDSGGDAHRDGQDVIDQEGRPGHQAREGADVLLCDDVGTSSPGVGMDGLAIREGHHQQQAGDDRTDRCDQPKGARPGEDQRAQDFLGGIGHRRERIGGKHGKAGGF